MNKDTTNLDQLKNKAEYTWGNIIKIHEMPDYAIIEYHPWIVKGVTVTRIGNEDKIMYAGYVKGKCINETWNTFDDAIIGCIAYKYEGPNHMAEYYFTKMIK
jgi:hypothetical protein